MSKKPLPKMEYTEARQKDVASFRGMIVGLQDTGKSSIAGSAAQHPDLAPLLFIDVDQRMTTLASTENIRRVHVSTARELDAVTRDLVQPAARRPELLRDIKTVVVDSISFLRDKVLQDRAEEATDGSFKRDDEYEYEYQDYGYASRIIANAVDNIVQSGVHVILLSHAKEVYNKEGHIAVVKPRLNDYLYQLVGGMMHHIWYTRRKDADTFRLLVLPKAPYRVKVTNPRFVTAVREYTRNQVVGDSRATSAEKLVELQDAAEGWVAIPEASSPTMPMLWDMYKAAVL